jgi:DNA segregation ATPase FtsK/SpoIIIE, S-DNA-T family
MSPKDFDHLVGAIALTHVRDKYRERVDDADFDGGFHVLSGFSPRQLAGFSHELARHPGFSQKVTIQFPAHLLESEGLPGSMLTTKSAVDVRNRDYEGRLVITAELEKDAGASLAECDRTDLEEIRSETLAETWIRQLCDHLNVQLIDDAHKQIVATTKGLFRTAGSNPQTACAFLFRVLSRYEAEGQIARAAGTSLPELGMPLFRACFNNIPVAHLGRPSAWQKAFETHYKNTCFLQKRDTKYVLLEPDKLRGRLKELREEQNPPLPDELLTAFAEYIEAKGTRSQQTEQLLFNFDWEYVRHCFDSTKASVATDLVRRTRDVLHGDDVQLTDEEDSLLDNMPKSVPRNGKVDDQVIEFFNRHASSIANDPRLLSQWESLVHGTKISCTDLFGGIIDCIERSWNKRTSGKECRIRLVGKYQEKPNRFSAKNHNACQFFERNYGHLQGITEGKVQFERTRLIDYHNVEEWLKSNGGTRKQPGKKANSFTFDVVIEEAAPDSDNWTEVDRPVLEWRFETASVLAEEAADFHRLASFLASGPKTSLIEARASYEPVGRKGSPLPLSLRDTQGISDNYGAGERGSFVPSKMRAVSLSTLKCWQALLEEARTRHLLREEVIDLLAKQFSVFQTAYDALMEPLSKNALTQDGISEMVQAYRTLVLTLCELPHESIRRQLLRAIMGIGTAYVGKAGTRPPLAITCPWHPLRIEAFASRARQFTKRIAELLYANPAVFSDASGKLYFRELRTWLLQPLYPEIALAWDSTQPRLRIVSQSISGYTLHEPAEPERGSHVVVEDESKSTAKQIEHLIDEYLRLQPHERNNLSVALYNCDSANLPIAVVGQINSYNDARQNDEVTCQVFLMHHDLNHLRSMYRELVAQGVGSGESSPTEATGDFLSKVRVNIVAASSVTRTGRREPIDIVYCKDLISKKAENDWVRRPRIAIGPDDLQTHQWSRRLPVEKGTSQAKLQLCCPAQTEAGWAYLLAVSSLCAQDVMDAWSANKCPIPMKILDFDNKEVRSMFDETHELATWVVNQDEILDRRLLEARDVKVIRYIQSTTQGRNLIISSKSKETLLLNTLREKLRDILPAECSDQRIRLLAERFVHEANQISGGLVLRAARRAKNTNELLGMVLSRFIVQTEIGAHQPAAWCFLDDYAQWLGKRDEAQIADLLVISPTSNADGEKILNLIVTEAKFIHADGLSEQSKQSERQLRDTLGQLEQALLGETASLDQDVWLSRLSDLLLTQLEFPTGQSVEQLGDWRTAIRNRTCRIRLWGYSHIFIHAPADAPPNRSKRVVKTKNGFQEVFSPSNVRELVIAFDSGDTTQLKHVRDQALLDELDRTPRPIATPLNAVPTARPLTEQPDTGITPPANESDGAPSSEPLTGPSGDSAQASLSEDAEPEALAETGQRTTQQSPSEEIDTSESPTLFSYLASAAQRFSSSVDDGQAWLRQTYIGLKSAFLARQLPFKAVDGFQPVLTPNAGIFRLQGSKDLTVSAIEARAEEIYTSDGIQILSVRPEPGRVCVTVARPNREILYSEPVLLRFIQEQARDHEKEELLVGIREEDGSLLCLNPFDQPHTLIAGATNSGKSVLLQNIILSIAATRSPDESQIFLIDPKCVDFIQLQDLLHVRRGSGEVIDTREGALECLNEAVLEMERRYQLFKAARVSNIRKFRAQTGEPLPTWWIIHDEFADWMQIEEYREHIPEIVNRLSVKARAAGIFLIFAAQRPDNTVFPIQMRDQLGNRLILQVQSKGTSEISLGEKGAERLLGRGHLLAKLGGEATPAFAQVPFIDAEHGIPPLVRVINESHTRRLGGNA